MTEKIPPPDWVNELTGENFIAVYDVSLDIRQELQFSDDPTINICPSIVKFSILMPGDGVNMRDRYSEFRWKATGLLKRKSVIRDFELLRGSHRWESKLRVKVDQEMFLQFVTMLSEVYKKRSSPNQAEDKSDIIANGAKSNPLDDIRRIILRFHAVVIQLRDRYNGRQTLDVSDEYDVQNLLHALLSLYFDDIRPEEWTPSYAGKSSRVDFLLKPEKIVIEVKKTRSGLGSKEIGDQLLIDIARYSKMSDCERLVCFIYDPENRIQNPGGLESDLSGHESELNIEVIVVPKLY